MDSCTLFEKIGMKERALTLILLRLQVGLIRSIVWKNWILWQFNISINQIVARWCYMTMLSNLISSVSDVGIIKNCKYLLVMFCFLFNLYGSQFCIRFNYFLHFSIVFYNWGTFQNDLLLFIWGRFSQKFSNINSLWIISYSDWFFILASLWWTARDIFFICHRQHI